MNKITFLILLTLLTAPPLGQKTEKPKHKEKIEAHYDKFQDRIFVRLEPMEIEYGVYLGAIASAEGNSYPVRARSVLLLIKFYNERWQCIDGCNVIFLVDGKRLALGQAGNLDRKVGYGSYPAIETIGVSVSPEMFRRIASASSVEFQAGTDEGALKQKHFAALLDLASRLTTPK